MSALAFAPNGDRLAVLAQSSPGRMTLRLIKPDRETIWERALTRNRASGYHLLGVSLAFSPDGRLLACTTGTSTVWVFEAATGQPVRQFEDHTQTVTGLGWIDDEWVLTAAADATLQVWRPDDAVPKIVVETIAAAGLTFVRERRTALVWSARGELLAWSLEGVPAQLWYRDPPARNVAAHFTRLAVSAVDGLLALIDAGAAELVLVRDWGRATASPPPAGPTRTRRSCCSVTPALASRAWRWCWRGRNFGPPSQPTGGGSGGSRRPRIPNPQMTTGMSCSGTLPGSLATGLSMSCTWPVQPWRLSCSMRKVRSRRSPECCTGRARSGTRIRKRSAGCLPSSWLPGPTVGINVSNQRIHRLMPTSRSKSFFKTSAKRDQRRPAALAVARGD